MPKFISDMRLKIKTMLVICMTCILNISKAQNFEGKITYALDFELSEKMRSAGITKDIMLEKLKSQNLWWDTIITSYKQGNTYSFFGKSTWSVYRTDSNKVFNFQNSDSSNICEVVDAAIDQEQVMLGKAPKITLIDTMVMINNIPCKIVRIKWKSGNYDYYFNAETAKIDPTLYSKYIYEGWAEFVKISGALPLKIVRTTKGVMSISMTMIKIEQTSVSDNIFTIPSLSYDQDLNALPMPNKKFYRF